jgi:GAF domain-containing protein
VTPQDAAADPQQIIADLERKLAESVAQQAAATEVLQIINGSGGDLTPVLDVMVTKAAKLCDATGGGLYLVEGDKTLNYGGTTSRTGAAPSKLMGVPLASILGSNPQDRPFVHVVDLKATKAYRNGVPFIVASVESDMRSWLGVPVINDGVIIAVFALFRKEVRPFSEVQIRLLQSFAVQASIAIKNARLFNETKEALEQQAATAEILKVINSSPNDLTPVFDIILEKAHSLCDITNGSLELYEGDIARSVAARGMNVRWEQYLRQGYKITETLRPAYMAVGHSHVIDMKKTVERFPDEPTLRGFVEIGGLRTFLALPLVKDGIVFGRIVAARAEVRPFTEKQITLLQSFADQAVLAIENARLLTEQREALERQTATADILKVISSSVADTTPVFEQILDSCERLAAFNRMAIFLLGEDGQVHIGAYRGGEGDALKATFPQPLANTPMSLAFECQQALFFGDVLNNPDAPASLRIAASRAGSFSVLVAPLLWEGRGIGAFHVARDANATFSDREVVLLKTFADQAAIAIQNARLFNETREALELQKASADILSVISSSVADAQPVFDKILESCKHLFGGDELDVLLMDERGQLNIAAYIGDFHDVVAATFPAPVERTPAGHAIRERRVMHWPDLVDGEDVPGVLRKMAKLIGYRSMVFAPMLWEGRGIGAIGVARSTGAFKPKELTMIQTFADQAVIAIQNARLFNETKEALERQTATADILKVIASSPSDVQPVFDAIAERSKRLVDALSTTVFRLDEGVLHLRAFTATNQEADAALKAMFPAPLSGFSWSEAVSRGETYRVLDTEYEIDGLRDLARLRGYRSMLFVPLLRDGTPIGLIAVTRVEPGPFVEHHVQLLQTFADQAVIAISNVQLFNEVEERTRELGASLDDLRTAQDRLVQTEKLASLGQLTAGIAHEIKNPLNFVNNFSALSAELIDELNDVLKTAALDDTTREEIDELAHMLKGNLEKVVQHGKRADSIVKNMLLHSREGAGEHRPADINTIVEESLNLAYHGARAEKSGFNITLQRDFDPAAGVIDLYPQEITRVFLNLISNGFYSATKRKDAGDGTFEPVLSATTKSHGNKVEIRIRDNGTGIPLEVKEKMFNPFFTTKPAGEGTGLGLSMSHDIVVKQHGGTIDVVTEPGVFTEFIITLPRSAAAQSNTGGTH